MLVLRSFREEDAGYSRLQHAVAASFAFHHAAHPTPHPDRFLCLAEPDGRLPGKACLGLNQADSGKLFSEHYLDEEIDAIYPTHRSQIIEIGQFASFQHGAGGRLLGLTLALLSRRNYRYAVLTATHYVRTLLIDLRVTFDALAHARIERCRDQHIDWGRYYQCDPQVIVIDLYGAPATSPLAVRSCYKPTPQLRREHSIPPFIKSTGF